MLLPASQSQRPQQSNIPHHNVSLQNLGRTGIRDPGIGSISRLHTPIRDNVKISRKRMFLFSLRDAAAECWYSYAQAQHRLWLNLEELVYVGFIRPSVRPFSLQIRNSAENGTGPTELFFKIMNSLKKLKIYKHHRVKNRFLQPTRSECKTLVLVLLRHLTSGRQHDK
jgi:hypothetical protein